MYAVIRLRGLVKLKGGTVDALKMMRLHRKMHCIVVKDDENVRGMIHRVKDYITWGEISDDVLKLMIQKRGRKTANERLTPEEAEVVYDKIISEGKTEEFGFKPLFRLSPPSKGFKKSIKQQFPNGELGYRGEKINDLLKRMI